MKTFILLMFVAALPRFCMAQTKATTQSANDFEPGASWLDTDGNPINCHGGGFIYQHGTYFWFGEHKVRRFGPIGQIGVGCYSSTDLYHWKNLGLPITASQDGPQDLVPGCIIERPKVLYNVHTKKYVMWFHLELRGQGYGAARAGVAISDTPEGPYKYLGSFRPNAGIWPINFPENQRQPLDRAQPGQKGPDSFLRRDFKGGQMCRDMSLFLDDDGTAYHIYASEENQTLQISKLSSDFLKPAGVYARLLVGGANEAPAIFKRDHHYYLITSGTTGWRPNAARLAVADHIMGPWRSVGNPCVGSKDQVELTFESQAATVLPVEGEKDAYIYVGDRWNARNLPDSRYIFLPISFAGDMPQIAWKNPWDLSVFH